MVSHVLSPEHRAGVETRAEAREDDPDESMDLKPWLQNRRSRPPHPRPPPPFRLAPRYSHSRIWAFFSSLRVFPDVLADAHVFDDAAAA